MPLIDILYSLDVSYNLIHVGLLYMYEYWTLFIVISFITYDIFICLLERYFAFPVFRRSLLSRRGVHKCRDLEVV